MNSWISNTAKKEFIQWFIQHYRFRNPDVRRILEVFSGSPQQLSNLQFTELVHPNERTLEISTTCASIHIPFVFHRPHSALCYNIVEAYQSLIQNPKLPTFLLLHFRGKQFNYKYQALVKGATLKVKEAIQNIEWSNLIVQFSLIEVKLSQINEQIDITLKNGDKDSFLKLTDERKLLKTELEKLLELKNKKNL